MWRDQIMRDAGEKGRDRKELETLFTQSRAVVTKALGLVLYLCAEKAEIQALDGQSPPVAQPTEPSVSHRHRELLVGYRTGPLLAGRQRSDRSVEARGHSPEPHLRRAHWHHYWVGAADDPERRLELRWISPTLVGGRPERLRVRDLDSRR